MHCFLSVAEDQAVLVAGIGSCIHVFATLERNFPGMYVLYTYMYM